MRIVLVFLLSLLLPIGPYAQQDDERSMIISNDQFPYEVSIQKANEMGDKILLGKAYVARGEYYEARNLKRESIKEYNKAYSINSTVFLYAHEKIQAIKNGMNKRISETQVRERELAIKRFEERERRMQNAAAISNLGNAIQSMANSKNTSKSNSQHQTTTNNARNTSSYSSSSYNSNSSSSSTYNNANKQRKCNICGGSGNCYSTIGAVTEIYKQYCRGDGKCHACGGTGRLSAMYTSGYIRCTYCDKARNQNYGNGICGKCHGTGKCHRCNGKGYL